MPIKTPTYVQKVVLINGGQIEKEDGTAIISTTSAWVSTLAPIQQKTLNTTLTGTRTITAAETGTTFFFGSSTEFVMTLPAVATSAGLQYRFICTAAPAAASYTIVTSGSENKMCGTQVNKAWTAGSYIADWDTCTFADWQAVAWDIVEFFCDWTLWYAYSICSSATGVVFTKAS